MAERNLAIRLSLKDADKVKKGLAGLGKDGQAALKRIEKASAPTSKGLSAVNKASQQGQAALMGMAASGGAAGRALAAMGPYGIAAAVGIGAAVATTGGMIKLANSAAATGDEFQKMSLRTGVSVENLSTLKFAAERSGAEFNTLEKGFQRMTRTAFEASKGSKTAAEAFEEIGVTVTDARGELRPTMDLVRDMSDGLKNMESDSKRAALAQQLFGRSGADLLPLLREGSVGIAALQSQARALGLEWSTSAANSAADYEDALTNMQGAVSALGDNLGSVLLPTFTAWINTLAGGVAMAGGFTKSLIDNYDAIKQGFADTASAILTAAVNFGKNLFDIYANVAEIVWQPLIKFAQFAFDHIRFHVIAPVWNAIGQDVVGVLNGIITEFNSFSDKVGFSIDHIDFTPLSTDAPKTISERWDEGVATVLANIDNIGAGSRKLFADVKRDASAVVVAYDTTLGKLIADAKAAGDAATAAVLQQQQAALAANGQADLVLPVASKGRDAGEDFAKTFTQSLSDGYRKIITDGEFTDAAKGIGEATVDWSISEITDRMAKKTVDFVTPWAEAGGDAAKRFATSLGSGLNNFFSGDNRDLIAGRDSPFIRTLRRGTSRTLEVGGELGEKLGQGLKDGTTAALEIFGLDDSPILTSIRTSASRLNNAGKDMGMDIGAGIQEGMTVYLAGKSLQQLGLNLPEEIIIPISLTAGALEIFAAGSAFWTDVQSRFNKALTMGTLAAGVGQMIGGEMTSAFAGAGASLGSLMGGPIATAIGAAIGGFFGLSEDKKQERRRQALSETVTEIGARGGFTEFLKFLGASGQQMGDTTAGGVVRFRDDIDVNQWTREEVQQRELVRQARLGLGLSKEGAAELVGSLFGVGPAGDEAMVSAEVLNALRAAGIDVTGGHSVSSTTPTQFSLNPDATSEPSGPAGKMATAVSELFNTDTYPYGTANAIARAAAHSLADKIVNDKPVKQSFLAAISPDLDTVLSILHHGGVPHTSGTAAAYFKAISSTPRLSTEIVDSMRRIYGIDIVAGRGFHGVVNRPTTILAGEAGPEAVNISPLSAGASTGVSGAGGTSMVFNFSISTPNVQSMKQWVENELFDLIATKMRRESFARRPLMSSKALING